MSLTPVTRQRPDDARCGQCQIDLDPRSLSVEVIQPVEAAQAADVVSVGFDVEANVVQARLTLRSAVRARSLVSVARRGRAAGERLIIETSPLIDHVPAPEQPVMPNCPAWVNSEQRHQLPGSACLPAR